MTGSLTIREKYFRYWPVVAAASGMLAVILFISYQLISDVLFASYLRLSAFICFALSLLSLFKIKDGRVAIKFEPDSDGRLTVTYFLRDKKVQQEIYTPEDIREIKIDIMPNRSIYNDLKRSERCLKIRKKKSEVWYYLNQVGGRVIPLREDDAAKTREFICSQNGFGPGL